MPPSNALTTSTLFAISYLLLTVLFFQLGLGLQAILVPIRAQLEGFSIPSIGLLGTAYYLGFVIGCLLIPNLLQQVGHIRVFSGFGALAAAVFLLHQFIITVPVWLGLRVAIGFCFSGLYIAIESWLNDQATTDTRGRILSIYMLVSWIAVIGGKLVFGWINPVESFPFALVSIGICLAVVPVAFGTGPAPAPATEKPLRLRELYRLSPVGFVGCLGIGATNGAFWTLGPIYAQSRGLSPGQIALFTSAAVLGGALSQWPIGRLSDWVDRRRIIAGSCLTAALAAGVLALGDKSNELSILALVLLFGAGALPLYALCLAHANDLAPSNTFVQISRHLLMVFGFGAIIGPYLGGWFMTKSGYLGLFLFTGSIHLALTGYTVAQILRRSPVSEAEKTTFVSVPTTTQVILELDPRSGDTENRSTGSQDKGESS